jgi:hypothetical protein
MAKRVTKAEREQAAADAFRALAQTLLTLRHNDWTDWEFDWLSAMSNRAAWYRFSEKENAKLEQLVRLSKAFTSYSGYSIQELIAIAYPFRFDLGEDDQEFLEKLHKWRAIDLRLRQVRRLARICRSVGESDIELDEAA